MIELHENFATHRPYVRNWETWSDPLEPIEKYEVLLLTEDYVFFSSDKINFHCLHTFTWIVESVWTGGSHAWNVVEWSILGLICGRKVKSMENKGHPWQFYDCYNVVSYIWLPAIGNY